MLPNAPLPASVQVAIIGGGIIGATTALELAERGISVVLLEKGAIAGEQSSRNWGWVRCMGRDVRELGLALRSRELWQNMAKRVGRDVGYRQPGIAYVAASDTESAKLAKTAAELKSHGISHEWIERPALSNRFPTLNPQRFQSALYCPEDGCAEPSIATQAIAEQAQRRGAYVLSQTAARGLEWNGGRISAVYTERGTVRCETVLVAAGAWTRLFLGRHGIDFTQLYIRSSVARLVHAQTMPNAIIGGSDFSFRRRHDGGYTVAIRNSNDVYLTIEHLFQAHRFLKTLPHYWKDLRFHIDKTFIEDLQIPRNWRADEITPFEKMRINPSLTSRSFSTRILKQIVAAAPAFAGASLTHTWSGIIDVTPQALPVISPISQIPGVYVASGFSGHGFGIGPAVGELLAEKILGTESKIDATPFAY